MSYKKSKAFNHILQIDDNFFYSHLGYITLNLKLMFYLFIISNIS